MREKHNSANTTPQAAWITVGTIGLFFFIFGFVTWLNGILIPYLKISCELNHFESYLVAFSFYVAYVIMAIPSSWLLKRTGLKMGMMIGLFVMSGGALFFIPAAMTRTYSLFLSGLAVGTPRLMSVVFIALLGMANSLIWPSVWPLGMLGKDPRTHASRQYGKSIIDFEIHKMAAVIQEELKH